MPNIVDTFTEYTQPRYLPSLEQWHCIRNALLCLFSVLSLEEFIELGNGIEVPVLCYLSSFLGPDKRKVSNSFREVGRSINFMHFPVVLLATTPLFSLLLPICMDKYTPCGKSHV